MLAQFVGILAKEILGINIEYVYGNEDQNSIQHGIRKGSYQPRVQILAINIQRKLDMATNMVLVDFSNTMLDGVLVDFWSFGFGQRKTHKLFMFLDTCRSGQGMFS